MVLYHIKYFDSPFSSGNLVENFGISNKEDIGSFLEWVNKYYGEVRIQYLEIKPYFYKTATFVPRHIFNELANTLNAIDEDAIRLKTLEEEEQ